MPPLLVKDYELSETAGEVFVRVPWPSGNLVARAADVYANDVYLKVHAAPYLFELDLARAVEADKSSVTLHADHVDFALVKKEPGPWNQVQYDGDDRLKRRHDAIDNHRELGMQAKKERGAQKAEAQRFLVRRQMEIEQSERERIAQLKKQEHEQAESEVLEWAGTTNATSLAPDESGIEELVEEDEPKVELDACDAEDDIAAAQREKAIFDEVVASPAIAPSAGETQSAAAGLATVGDEDSDEDDPDIQALRAKYAAAVQRQKTLDSDPGSVLVADSAKRAPPRARAKIEIAFTPRLLRTAARETEDAKWMAHMEEARRRRHPQQSEAEKLERKARELLEKSQYIEAIDALSAVLELTPKNHRCLMARAECHWTLKIYDRAADDAAGAIDLIEDLQEELARVSDTSGAADLYNDDKETLRALRDNAAAAHRRQRQEAQLEQTTPNSTDGNSMQLSKWKGKASLRTSPEASSRPIASDLEHTSTPQAREPQHTLEPAR